MNKFSKAKKFAKHFSSTYLKQYSIDDWSVLNNLNISTITNNMVELHNLMLNKRFVHLHLSIAVFNFQKLMMNIITCIIMMKFMKKNVSKQVMSSMKMKIFFFQIFEIWILQYLDKSVIEPARIYAAGIK